MPVFDTLHLYSTRVIDNLRPRFPFIDNLINGLAFRLLSALSKFV